MKIGFTGTQRGMTDDQCGAVLDLIKPHDELHHGDCIGADNGIHMVVPCAIVIHPPLNPKKRAFCTGADKILPPKDYLDRNHDIVDATDFLIAAPGEMTEQLRSGTWATIRYARKRGKQVAIIYPDGSRDMSGRTSCNSPA